MCDFYENTEIFSAPAARISPYQACFECEKMPPGRHKNFIFIDKNYRIARIQYNFSFSNSRSLLSSSCFWFPSGVGGIYFGVGGHLFWCLGCTYSLPVFEILKIWGALILFQKFTLLGWGALILRGGDLFPIGRYWFKLTQIFCPKLSKSELAGSENR